MRNLKRDKWDINYTETYKYDYSICKQCETKFKVIRTLFMQNNARGMQSQRSKVAKNAANFV